MRRRKIALILRTASLSAAGIFALSPPLVASADFFLNSWENHYRPARIFDLHTRLSHYATQKNFDDVGALFIPNELNRYSRIQTDLDMSWGISRRLTVYGRSSWAHVELKHESQPGSVFGLGDQSLGATFRIYERFPALTFSPTSFDLQAQVDFPAYNNNRSAEAATPFLGDGSIDVTVGAFMALPLAQNPSRSVLLSGGAGYTRRTDGFSAGVPWSLTAEYRPSRPERFFGSLTLGGLYSLATDQSAWLGGRSNLGAGGSFIVHAVNPSLASVRGTLGYQLTRALQGYVALAQPVAGQRAPSGLHASLGFRATLGSSDRVSLLSEAEHPHANRGFINYSLEAKVLRTNDRLHLIKINKGRQDGVELGEIFDIFEQRQNNPASGQAIARGRVTAIRLDEADIGIVEIFKEVWIEEGFVARRLIR